jgi:uncharacterized membrane protein YkoI
MLACSLLAAPTAAAYAQSPGFGSFWSPGESSSDAARQPMIPVRQAYRAIESRFGGEAIDLIGLYQQGNGMVYVIAWLSGSGRRLEVTVDAHSGAILASRGG